MATVQIKDLLKLQPTDQIVEVKGWVRTKRESKNAVFIALNDGSTINNIQAVGSPETIAEDILKLCTTGACLKVTGKLIASQGSGQDVEVQIQDILVYGAADPEKYPLQPKRHSLEF